MNHSWNNFLFLFILQWTPFKVISVNVIIRLILSKTFGPTQMYSNELKNDYLMWSLHCLMLSNFEPIGLFSKSNSLLRRASYCIGLGYHEDILPSVKADSRNFEMGSIISTKVLLIIYSVSGTGNQQFLISLFLDTYALSFVYQFHFITSGM